MDAAERDAWRQADELFGELVELAPATRAARLAQLPPGSQLRRFVERLLAADQAGSGLLERAIPIALLPQAQGALTGRRLGRWRLLEEIGRGGMSVVYRAVADEGAAGQVAAVKVLTLGALAAQGRDRFLQEQQALLRLRHPYLVTLYDAGVAEDGTPWLAMALVDGQRIDQWCEQRALDATARVRLLLQVCEALAYTHRNLVIHRDIKPSNVMVDDDGHVRLLDFGIARLVDGDGERTRTALRALTPEYAAPEQFTGASPSTAMDVYGLGALLYRLLTGQPPFSHDGPGAAAPPPPSALARGDLQLQPTERRRRARSLRGDLDTVVMKALAGRPEDRYDSVEGLAEDLRCWLAQRPVRARPPNWPYRLHKFIARHRAGAAVSALLVMLLVAGVAGTLWQARLAGAEARRAQAAVAASQAQLDYLDSVLEMMTPSTEQARDRDQRALVADIALRARRDLGGRPALLANVEMRLGGVANRIGAYDQALALYAAAMGRRRLVFGLDSVPFAEARLHWAEMLGYEQAATPVPAHAQLRAAVATLQRRQAEPQLLAEALILWAGKLAEGDHHQEALAALGQAAEPCRRLRWAQAHVCEQALVIESMVAHRSGHPHKAMAPMEKLLALRRQRYGEDDARTLFALSGLGKTYAYTGQRERGLALLERAHAMQERIYRTPTRETVHTLQALSSLLGEMGRYPRALALARRQLDQAAELFGPRHEAHAAAYSHLGDLLAADGRYAEASAAHQRAHAAYAGLAGHAQAQAGAASDYASALRELGRPDQALLVQRKALAQLEQAGSGDPAVRGAALASLARIELARGRPHQSLPYFDRSIAIYRALPGDRYHAALVTAYRSEALRALGRHREASETALASLRQIEAALGPDHRHRWEALALQAQAACFAREATCSAAAAQVRGAVAGAPAGGARRRLEQAAASLGR